MVVKVGIAIPSDLEPRSNTYKCQIAIPSDSEHVNITPKCYS